MKVALIDDDRFLLKVLELQIRSMGFDRIFAFDDANRALAHLTDQPDTELVLCDLQMPEMDGVEFIRYLALTEFSGALVLMSGEGARILRTAKSLALAHDLKILGTLNKPVTPKQLRPLLESMRVMQGRNDKLAFRTYPEAEVQAGIEEGQIVNFYQPKVSMNSGAVIGMETLVRWDHPDDGMLSPDRFVPVAEKCHLIEVLTTTVLDRALQDLAEWTRYGWELGIAINISMRNLDSLSFPDRVVKAACRAGVPVSRITLELTESQIMSDPAFALDILTRLRLKHISLSIDDFGTGYSSLQQLSNIPFNELKFDRSFVHGVSLDLTAASILEAGFEMAKRLGMTTVAEGVETESDWAWLAKSGKCDVVQGYLISKPMPQEELLTWLDAWKASDFRKIGSVS